MKVKNLSQFKKAIKPGVEFVIKNHWRSEHIGQHRVVTIAQSNGFYSAIKDDPNHPISQANRGKGYWCDFGKAGDYDFSDGTLKLTDNPKNQGVFFEFELV